MLRGARWLDKAAIAVPTDRVLRNALRTAGLRSTVAAQRHRGDESGRANVHAGCYKDGHDPAEGGP